jgi:hypothetical protein
MGNEIDITFGYRRNMLKLYALALAGVSSCVSVTGESGKYESITIGYHQGL